MRRPFVLLALVALGTTSTAVAQGDIDPIGTYQFQATGEGQPTHGTIVITGSPGNWSGTLALADGPPPGPLSSVQVSGNTIMVAMDGGSEGVFRVTMVVTGSRFSGTWTLAGQTGQVTGRKTG